MLNHVTIDGNLVRDPELRFIPSGAAVVNFTVAHTPRKKQGDEWVDGETVFLECSQWRDAAENVAESLVKGMHVMVSGKLACQTWQDKSSGDKRSKIVLEVEEVGPSLRRQSAKVNKTQRSGAQPQGGQQSGGWGGQQQDDPWATPAPQREQPVPFDGRPNSYDEPPF